MAEDYERQRSGLQVSRSAKGEPQTPRSLAGSRMREPLGMEDSDGTLASVAQCIEQLRSVTLSPHDKETVSKQLLVMLETRENAKTAVGSHSQAIPLLVALLRSGTVNGKINAAATMAVLCKEEELRVKVLLGGCIPPLLALLRVGSLEAQTAAAKAVYAVTKGGVSDHVGSKIFSTEGVVPSLWEQFQPGHKLETAVLGLLTGALCNLCKTTVEGFWPATIKGGGIEILVGLLRSNSPTAQANAGSLLNSLMTYDASTSARVLAADAVGSLLSLLSSGNQTSVRAEAAGALKALSHSLKEAKQSIVSAHGVPRLIGAVVAPSKEFMQGEFAQALQQNAMGALANILGGMPAVIDSLGENISSGKSDSHIADMIGALAYALMVIDETSESEENLGAAAVERILVKQMRSSKSDLVQERAIEALASLYGNSYMAKALQHAEGKRMVVGLVTLAGPEVQDEIMKWLISLCSGKTSLWDSIHGRDGVQLLISLLGISSEQQQEYAVSLLSILSQEIDESNWAITASGGIPPLVQLLETGSSKAREDAAIVLGNLCNHSEDIRACVETAEAVPALLWLLRNASSNGQEISAGALTKLIRRSDPSTISQLTAMLNGDLPDSKVHVLDVLGCLLSFVSQEEISNEASSAYEALETLMNLLDSTKEETQERAALVLARIFDACKHLRESEVVVKNIAALINLLQIGKEAVAMQAARALAFLFYSVRDNENISHAAKNAVFPLISLAESSNMASAEVASMALANLLLDIELAMEVPAEDMILPLTKVIQDGSEQGKEYGATALARILRSHPVIDTLAERIRESGTVVSLAGLLGTVNFENIDHSEALEALASLARVKSSGSFTRPPLAVLAEAPYSLSSLVTCLAVGIPHLREKAIEVLSRLCQDQPVLLGDLIAGTPRCVAALANSVINSSSVEVKAGGTALLICAAKEHRGKAMEALHEVECTFKLIQALVDMLGPKSLDDDLSEASNVRERTSGSVDKSIGYQSGEGENEPATALGGTVALWLLSVIASHDSKSKVAIMEAGAIDVLADKLAVFVPNAREVEVEENGSTWVCALLLAILFQDRDVTRAPATMRAIPSLAILLKSEEAIDRYFAAQALASLVCHGSRGALLGVANSGAVGGLISLLGSLESDISSLVALSEEFSLVHNPDQVALERLFRVDDIRFGATARKAIPMLVDLLKPIPGRPGAPPLALELLTQIAEDSNVNKLAMAETGALDALTKYLSLGPQDAIEEATADLMRILFSCAEVRRHESAFGAVDQLVAVLRMGTRDSRYTASQALETLFSERSIKIGDAASQSIQPLAEMLNTGTEKEQYAAVGALLKLTMDNPPKALALVDHETNPVVVLSRIMSSESPLELKESTADLCRVLFANARIRSKAAATTCIQPLVELLANEVISMCYAAALALDALLDDEQQAEAVATYGAVGPFVSLLTGSNYAMHEVAISALIKLGKDRPVCKLDMVKAEVMERILYSLPVGPDSFCALGAELLRILTNNSSIAKSEAAAKVVEPLFTILTRPDLSPAGQHSAMQVLVNILEKNQSPSDSLSPHQTIEPLIRLLDSSSQPVQQLAAELLSYLLMQDRFQRDIITEQLIVPLVRFVGIRVQSLQQKALKALEWASNAWPCALVEAGGIMEISKVILQVDPQPPYALWESAVTVLTNILRYSALYYQDIPIPVLVKMLRSSSETTVVISLSSLMAIEREDGSSADIMAESGAIEALLEILRCHQCEESAARLLEALFNSVKVREMTAAKLAISPLAEYLMDPRTQTQQAKLLAALSLGDLFQHEIHAKATDAVSACRALVSLLEGQPTEEIKMVAVCALQNLVVSSRANRRAVAEAGGIQALQDLLSSSDSETASQAAALIKLMFSNQHIQEYASGELIQALVATLERDLWGSGSVKDDVVKAIAVLFNFYPRLRITEYAILSIPQLIGTLKAGPEVAQEAALDSLFYLRQVWSSCPPEVTQAQISAMSEAIPVLQMLMRNGPQRFYEKIDAILQCLPGNLIVTIKRGNNLKQSMGSTSAFCKVTLGNGQPRKTKVVSNSTSPEWEQGFAWAFDAPPKGQKLHISCRSKSTFGKGSLGKVSIQIDRVVMLGTLSGEYQLKPDTNRDGTPRTLEIEFQWAPSRS